MKVILSQNLTFQVIYDDLKNAQVQHCNLGNVSLRESYNKLAQMAENVISDMLGGVWFYQNINNWYKCLICRAQDIRFNKPEIFSMLVSEGKLEGNRLFHELIDLFGTPIVTNSNHIYDFYNPKNVIISKNELMNVYAMMQLPSIFMSTGLYSCPLRKYYQQQCGIRKQYVDKRCVKEPWLRMRKWNRCLLNQWLYFKGFKDIKFIF